MTDEFTLITYKNGRIQPHYKSKAYQMWSYYRNHENRLVSAKKRYDNGYKEICAKYYEDNKEYKLKKSKDWDENHPGYRSDYMKTRRKLHPGKVRTEERLKELKVRQRTIIKSLLPEIVLLDML